MSFQRSSHRICILILGMHRSGTSCLAGSLQKRGVFLGQVHEVNPHNRKGNRENQRLVDLNTKILQYNHADWDRPPQADSSGMLPIPASLSVSARTSIP